MPLLAWGRKTSPMRTKRWNGARRGFVLVTTLVSMVVMLAFVGLAVDVGYLECQKTRMQTAADAAAIGGVQEFKMNGSATVGTAARADAALNGFTNGVNGVSVTVNNPPASGHYTDDATAVEVIVTQAVPAFFMQLVGSSPVVVQARSVAHQAAGTTCIFALDPSMPSAFSVSGGVTVQSACGAMVDSSSSTALVATGGSHLTAPSILVAGNYSINGGASVTPAPTPHVMAQSDPLAYIAAPTVGACTQTNYSVGGGQVKTAYPGVYCNGISISNGATVTFSAGTYILKGGGFSISGGSTISGTNVTFYNTAGGGYTYQPISLSNGITVRLSAPTTGSLAGILFFQDRSITSGAANVFTGGTSAVLNGALYFPSTALTYSGGVSAAGNYTILVAKSLNFSGGVNVSADYSSLPSGSPVRGAAALSE